MKISLPFWLRAAVTAAIFFTWVICMICNVFDGFIKNAPIVFVVLFIVLALLCAGISKGMLPTKKVVKQSVESWNAGKHHQAIINYGIWICMWIAFYAIWFIIYTAEM
jgi:hypothetical protein